MQHKLATSDNGIFPSTFLSNDTGCGDYNMSLLRNIVTFGASGRIEKKLHEFEDLQFEYEQLFMKTESKRASVNSVLEQVIKVKLSAVESLKEINKISQNLKTKDRELPDHKVGNDVEDVHFERIGETITAADAAINLTKGVSAGVGTALGAWALVSSIGTASTGSAIAGLSGAAATNATLAWFGGGALAAGGGGMMAGTAVLGGIVVLPALALAGVFSHLKANKQIKEIEENMLQVVQINEQLNDNILKLEVIEMRSQELIVSIKKAEEAFTHELAVIYKQVYPIPLFSKLAKTLRKRLLRRNYFSNQDLQNIAYIGSIANEFATLIDTKVFE
ncbi:hypothetical protein [Tumebacillus permanentifrigoris]|uniref:Uncharacterized protein n=1 Tax=Tumebacillus permanentifrigoris TaxID=378543 RepID=A0A316DEM3_9BACL|nr:hypothetical protein [Tumebacillus permanentifrigoris]PWK16494.1 hypothetical protein C7459_101358 [Tumebacillus permanentifrigoris]